MLSGGDIAAFQIKRKSDQWNINETSRVLRTQKMQGKHFNESQYAADGKTSLIKAGLSVFGIKWRFRPGSL